jgi:hypothetical protein
MSDGRPPSPIYVPAGHSASGYVHAVGGDAQGGSGYKTDPGLGGGVSCAVCAGPEQRRDTTAANGEA